MTQEDKAEALATRMFRRRISLSKFERWCAGEWNFEEAPKHGIRERIRELLAPGRYVITTGWTATSIRGHHNFWIIWRVRSSVKNRTHSTHEN